MTAYKQIKNSIEMTAPVRAVITDNPEEVSLMDLKEEEYRQFTSKYLEKPYEAIRTMNSFVKRIKNKDMKSRHVASAVSLECLVENEKLNAVVNGGEETMVMQGIKRFLANGYTELCTEQNNTGRKYQEKFRVDKRSIAGILAKCKAIAVNTEDDYSALREIAGLVANTMQYNQKKVEKIWNKNRDETVMIKDYIEQEAAGCRQYAVLLQLGLQEAGIKSKLQIGINNKNDKGHIWVMAETSKGFTLADASTSRPFVVSGAYETECYEKARKEGWDGFIVLNGNNHFFKYSTRGIAE